MYIRGSIGSYDNHHISYELYSEGEHKTFNIDSSIRRRELFVYIDELNENFVMLDMYIRKILNNEFPELFILKNNFSNLYN